MKINRAYTIRIYFRFVYTRPEATSVRTFTKRLPWKGSIVRFFECLLQLWNCYHLKLHRIMPRTRILICYLKLTSVDVTDSVHSAVGTQIMTDILSTFNLPGDVDLDTTATADNFKDFTVDQIKEFEIAGKQWKSQFRQGTPQEIVKKHHEGLSEVDRPAMNEMYNFFKDGITYITVNPTSFKGQMDDVFTAYPDDKFLVVFLGHNSIAVYFEDKFALTLTQYKSRVDCGIFFVCQYGLPECLEKYMHACETPFIVFKEKIYLPTLYAHSHYAWLFYAYIRWGLIPPRAALTAKALIDYQEDNGYPFEAIKQNFASDTTERKQAFFHCIAFAKQVREGMHRDDLVRCPEEGTYIEGV